ncbi:hypothetical protein NL676_004293 [Syzygium grande]|nr:hypothetical protein NL676_004293 [Syzygium grande]
MIPVVGRPGYQIRLDPFMDRPIPDFRIGLRGQSRRFEPARVLTPADLILGSNGLIVGIELTPSGLSIA